MTRKTIVIISIVAAVVILAIVGLSIYCGLTILPVDNEGYYLFCYFTGNSPSQEKVHFAISDNGYKFVRLRAGYAMINQKLGTGCCRDPYVFRANGKYYVIATDMKSSDGWNSNHAMIIFESENLIYWGGDRVIDIKSKEGYEHTCRTWAPQVIYDKNVDKYLVYWSHCEETNWDTHIVYAYLNDDFTDIGEIKDLYNPERIAIDADIIYENDKYYLYYKDEDERVVRYVYSDNLTGPYIEPEESKVSKSLKDVEGNCMFKLEGTDTYLMMMDEYSDGRYFIQATTKESMTEFKPVRRLNYRLPKGARHGSVLKLTQDEYYNLKNWDSSVGLWSEEDAK